MVFLSHIDTSNRATFLAWPSLTRNARACGVAAQIRNAIDCGVFMRGTKVTAWGITKSVRSWNNFWRSLFCAKVSSQDQNSDFGRIASPAFISAHDWTLFSRKSLSCFTSWRNIGRERQPIHFLEFVDLHLVYTKNYVPKSYPTYAHKIYVDTFFSFDLLTFWGFIFMLFHIVHTSCTQLTIHN